jgi:hypothetical protein
MFPTVGEFIANFNDKLLLLQPLLISYILYPLWSLRRIHEKAQRHTDIARITLQSCMRPLKLFQPMFGCFKVKEFWHDSDSIQRVAVQQLANGQGAGIGGGSNWIAYRSTSGHSSPRHWRSVSSMARSITEARSLASGDVVSARGSWRKASRRMP